MSDALFQRLDRAHAHVAAELRAEATRELRRPLRQVRFRHPAGLFFAVPRCNMLALLLACAPNPPPPAVDHIPDGTLQVRHAGAHEVSVRRAADGPYTELVLDGRVVLGGRWNPDRPAVDDDGAVAFVSGVTGIASVYVRAPGGEPVQLTNVGLEGTKRRPGQPPPGFVPPPVDDSLVFDGDRLTWNGPDGPVSAPLTAGSAHEVRR